MRNHNMLDYIHGEFYKVIHRKYTWWFLLAMLAGAGLLVAGWAYTNANGNDVGFATGAGILGIMLTVGLYCTLITGDIVFSDQYKFNTLKNEVSYGVPRTRIYLGKLLVSCVVAIIACVIIIGFYLALCWVVLPHSAADGEIMKLLGFSVLNALPLWLGSQALVMLCLSFFKGSTVASFVFIGIIMGLPEILKLMGLLIDPAIAGARAYLLTGPFDVQIKGVDWGFFGKSCIIGAAWFAVTTFAGTFAFRKREIS